MSKDEREPTADGEDEIAPENLLGRARGVEIDPLESLGPDMELVDVDWFDRYYEKFVVSKTDSQEYRDQYLLAFRDWKEHMESHNRHPTLPAEEHVDRFIEGSLRTQSGDTVKTKLRYIREVYQWMQRDPRFPHPTDWDPFYDARERHKKALNRGETDDFPKLDEEEVARKVGEIKHIGERAVTVFQLKTGVRSSELWNVRFSDITLTNREVMEHYEPLGIGSDPILEDIQNAVYIPRDKLRHKNKRKCPTVIPLDDETRQTLVDYLLIRPDNEQERVFLTKKGKPMDKGSLRVVWENNWHPEYKFIEKSGSEGLRSISPHFARHWMTTWFRTKKGWNEPLVQYLRGDKMGPDIGTRRSAMHRYVHSKYEDIEERYRDDIFNLKI